MLELRPSCEHCNRPLPPNSPDARICSFECTFCAHCVEHVMGFNACPNCGGGLVPRPVRPANDWRGGNYLGQHPASTVVKHRPIDLASYRVLVESLAGIAPERR